MPILHALLPGLAVRRQRYRARKREEGPASTALPPGGRWGSSPSLMAAATSITRQPAQLALAHSTQSHFCDNWSSLSNSPPHPTHALCSKQSTPTLRHVPNSKSLIFLWSSFQFPSTSITTCPKYQLHCPPGSQILGTDSTHWVSSLWTGAGRAQYSVK